MRPAAATAGLVLLWMLPGLFGRDPWKPDDAYTFGLVLHILQSGDWVVPTLAGEPFLEKPPVFFLTAALFARLFDGWLPLHDGARVATAFYMTLSFVFLALAATRLHGRGAGSAAVLLLAGSLGLVDRGHQLITDTAQLAGFAVAIYGLALSLQRPLAGGLALGTGAGLGFLAKGLFAPGCLALAALALPAVSRLWRTAGYSRALVVAALAASPWLLVWPAALYARGPEMLEEWLWGLNVGSFIGEESIAPKPSPFFYLWVLPWFALPSWPLAAWAVWQARHGVRLRPEITLPVVLAGVLVLVLTISRTGRELYAMPVLLPLCLLAAGATRFLPQPWSQRAWRAGLAAMAAVAGTLWLMSLSLDAGLIPALQDTLLRSLPGYAPRIEPAVVALGAGYTALVAAAVWQARARPERMLAAWTGALALAWGLSMILLLRYVDTAKSYRAMIGELSAALPPSYVCLASRGLGEPQRALLHYFAGIVTVRNERSPGQSRCDLLLVQGFRGTIAVPGPSWQPVWEGARPGDARELYRLYRRSPP